jgi:hypothetical protein
VGYAFNNFTAQTHAVRLRPTIGPPPVCSFQCLRSTSIELQSRGLRPWIRRSVRASVTVQDELGASVPQALVVGRWTKPDGSTYDQSTFTDTNGVAAFLTLGGPSGTYTFMVVNVVRSLYTFDPTHSVLQKSIVAR